MKPQRKIKSKFHDVMVDLETLGITPGCVILSIGAVTFDPLTGQFGDEFYVVINTQSCLEAGLTIDESTIEWWSHQTTEARIVIDEAKIGGELLVDAMTQFTDYLQMQDIKQVRIWGNGADFDNAILSCCYKAVNQLPPWSPWNNRCYRTLKNLVKGPKLKREGTYHNALDDAKTQAKHAIQLLQ